MSGTAIYKGETMEDIPTFSHSQLQEWRKCKFSWNLSYVEKWQPKSKAYPLRLGSAVHSFLENYYKGVIEGVPDALAHHQTHLQDMVNSANLDDSIQVIANAAKLVERYITEFALFEDQGFIPVEVEKHYTVRLETPKGRPYNFELYFDLLFLHEESNKLWMVDHKTHNSRPFSDTDILMDPQLPAYAMAMREKMDVNIFGLMYNLLNTYDYKKPAPSNKLFDRKRTYRTPEELDAILKETGATVDDILENKDNHYRSLTRDCSWCKFQEPCLMAMKGMDVTPIMEELFEKKVRRPNALEQEESSVSRPSL
jgi:hypothetical protein